MGRKRGRTKQEFVDEVERLYPQIENEEALIAERNALIAKPVLDDADDVRLTELIRIVGHSLWEDETRTLLRKAAALVKAEINKSAPLSGRRSTSRRYSAS